MGSLAQGLGPPSAAPPASSFFLLFHACRPVYHHFSCHSSRPQQLVCLATEPLNSLLSSSTTGSSFYGDFRSLTNQRRWYRMISANEVGELFVSRRHTSIIFASEYSKTPFQQSYQRRGSFDVSTGRQFARTSSFVTESQFTGLSNVDSDFNQRFNPPESLDQSYSPTSLEIHSDFEVGSRPLGTGITSERSKPLTLEGSPLSNNLSDDSEPNSCRRFASRIERGSAGAGGGRLYPPPCADDSKFSSASTVQRYTSVIGHPRVMKMATQPCRREDQNMTMINGRKCAGPESLRSARHGKQVSRLETSHPVIEMGTHKWREAAKIIQQSRRPIGASGRVEVSVRNNESVSVELDAVANFENMWKGQEIDDALQIHEVNRLCKDKEKLDAIAKNSVRVNSITEERTKLSNDDLLGKTELSSQQDHEQQWMNAEVLVVGTVTTAQSVVEKLRGQYKDAIHACDTEVAGIDVKRESPVGHGRLICFSIYCGPKADFGGGKSRLWVDVLDKDAVLDVFKSYFEDPNIKKVWHNYSFDKHILGNHGINVQGFHADTMHLARLHDSARSVVQGGYSLEGLTADKQLMGDHWGELKKKEEADGKRSMKHLFGKPNIKKNGEEGKLCVVPPVEELQTQPQWRDKWIHYSSFDTVCTWCLWSSLSHELKRKDWVFEGKFKNGAKSMYDFYEEYLRPFGELLVQMEVHGMLLDLNHLEKIEEVAVKQQQFSANQFKMWAAQRCPDAIYMNVGSDAQIRQLLYGGKENRNDPNKKLEVERIFNTPNTENVIEEGRKVPKKTRPFTLHSLGVDISADTYTSAGWPAVGGASLRALAGKVAIDYNILDETESTEDLLLANPVDDTAVLTSAGLNVELECDLSVYGKAYGAFGGGKEGKEACIAFAALCEVASINTLISNFIQPLQGNDIKGPNGRVHCSLNINTETGRLSARRPSLQNQPALEKDRYKIRQAFIAAPGNSLIVADYGQLELRILAHLTDCKSMLKAFEDGGDFHSRTAMNMYPHVRRAVERGDVILEWEPKPDEKKPPVPLLKDIFGAERRKAKMLNFSIAYGKTAMGLSKDWKVSLDEAKSTVELWYSDRKEVRRWQEERIAEAKNTHHVHTLLGRTRHFPDVKSSNKLVRGHIERAAINTPVQGSAADVAMCAMLEINRNKILQELGWKLLLQVHDEVILEGPAESAEIAKDIVVQCMGFPFGGRNPLKVALAVDAKYAQNWYAAK